MHTPHTFQIIYYIYTCGICRHGLSICCGGKKYTLGVCLRRTEGSICLVWRDKNHISKFRGWQIAEITIIQWFISRNKNITKQWQCDGAKNMWWGQVSCAHKTATPFRRCFWWSKSAEFYRPGVFRARHQLRWPTFPERVPSAEIS